MKTVPISGTVTSVTFFEDDTIETVRQSVALAVNSHPDRLFLEVKATLPKDYYATNPSHWTALFLRLSFDGIKIPLSSFKTYVTQTRPGTGVAPQEVTREQWEEHAEFLKPLYDPEVDFDEWRILGVEEAKSFCLPLPPTGLPDLRAGSRPAIQTQSLFETLHPYEVTEIRSTVIPDPVSDLIKLNYFPRFRDATPPNIESLRDSIETQRATLQKLLEMDTPKHETVSIVRAKWYIPLISTRISAPRARFEQMFYGMTVNKTTPYVGYFTSKTEATRHKFFVTDPKTKVPLLDIPIWKSWMVSTQPQRRRPTLLLYRGTSRMFFDRIAVTEKDITVDIRREKNSKETLEDMSRDALAWMKSLDALTPFIVASDMELGRWELSDLSVVATYAKEIRDFNMHRMQCLQTLFSVQDENFRLLRAEHTSEDISPRELQALQVLAQDDVDRTPETLVEQLKIPLAEATEIFANIEERLKDLNLEKSLKAYPTIKFSAKEVILKFATNLDRTLHYVDILRHVLTSDSEDVEAVCPERAQVVQAKVAVPQEELVVDEGYVANDEFDDLLAGLIGPEEEGEAEPAAEEPAAGVAAAPSVPPKARRVRVVASRQVGTYNYFNNRLQSFDAATFDKAIFPSKCDKPRQPIALTPADKARLGTDYDFSSATDLEKLELADPDGTVICPPYWCMRDEAPLREDQLVLDAEGTAHCPLCNGKVRTSDSLDTTEYPVIKRDTLAKFPDVIKQVSTVNKRKIPCCFQTPRAAAEVLAPKEDANYVLDPTSAVIPGLRFTYLSPELAEQLGVTTSYDKTIKKGRLMSDDEDIFRVGLGRPSKTLPILLNDKTPIPRPRDAQEKLLKCSFFRNWKSRGPGDTEIDRIVASIDQAYQTGGLTMLEELEYVAAFLTCEVIRVDVDSAQVVCGFWSDSVGPSSRTIAVLDTTVLARVKRVKVKKSYKSEYLVDLRKPDFAKTLPILLERHARACATNAPRLADAVALTKGKADYQVILDPFKRIQAVFIPGVIVLPVQPSVSTPDKGAVVRSGYADIPKDELPKGAVARAFLSDVKNPMFQVRSDITNLAGQVVELELASGFRSPIQPEEGKGEAREVVQTIQAYTEDALVNSPPNPKDIQIATEVSYGSEITEFLLFSISKDIQTDDYAALRRAIETRSAVQLPKELEKWFKAEAYEDTTKSPMEFVNKVRTPCGQFTEKDSCASSTLCGWKTVKGKGVCKVRVKPVVDKALVLSRIDRTLRENDKQRALVLDDRMSPFFSTILYLELPHELITTTI